MSTTSVKFYVILLLGTVEFVTKVLQFNKHILTFKAIIQECQRHIKM